MSAAAGLPRWGVCTTLRADPDQVLAFVAHYLDLGANRIWVHFDDPEDPAADLLTGRKRVTAVRCTEAYWQELCGGRPDQHQIRQMRNATRVCRRAKIDFVLHADVDEFLLSVRPVPEVLAELPSDQLVLRAEPWEALFEPGLPDDIFTARHFRRAAGADARLLARLYGPYGALLRHGMLSHTVGKCFFRTGVAGMDVHIHGARIRRERVPGGEFCPDLALLHFHAEDPARWKAGLGFRLSRGAYTFLPTLQAHLTGADAEEVERFYTAVQVARPDLLAALGAAGLLRQGDLRLRAKVAALGPA